MIGRKDMRKETLAKRTRSKVMDDKMASKMMSPRKMMSMGKSPGPGMGADSAPMPFKKGGAVTKGSIMGTGKTKASAKSDYMKKMKAAGFASGGVVARRHDLDRGIGQIGGAQPGPMTGGGPGNVTQPGPMTGGKSPSKRLEMTAEQYQMAKAQNTDLGQMNPEQRAQARQARMEYLKTRPNQLNRDPATVTNPTARKSLQNTQMMQAQRDLRKAKLAGAEAPSTQAFKKGGMVKKPASKNPMSMGPKGGKAGMMLIIGLGKKGK